MRLVWSSSIALAVFLTSVASLYAWGNDGHQIVAYIAAAHLNNSARGQVAKILNVTNDPNTVAEAMAAQSTRPDTEFRPRDRSTGAWHFVDLCLQDTEADIAKRCGNGCVTSKIEDYEDRLKNGNYDQWGADGDLAFLIHLMGDIHQPLHDATNADKGANCIRIKPGRAKDELHGTWDTDIVEDVERKNHESRGVEGAKATAQALDRQFSANPPSQSLTWRDGGVNDIAWESTQVARTEIYQKLNLKEQPCEPEVRDCAREAPAEVRSEVAELTPEYRAEATDVAARQLYVAGMRLASLLNQIWP